MKPNLQTEFIADKENSHLTIKREFLAPRQLVWDCYTKSELLNHWFAPKPMTTKTKSMDFRDGGHWHYVMIDPNGKGYWGYTEYIVIKPIDYYSAFDAFSNETGEINKELPRAKWKVDFFDRGEKTLVVTLVQYNSPTDLETVVQMGMEQGMTMTLEKLDELLVSLQRHN